jgi:hypothetical protein
MTRLLLAVLAILGIGALVAGVVFLLVPKNKLPNLLGGPQTFEVELTEYHPPRVESAEVLVDDKLEDKKPTPFDPALVDPRPLGPQNEWQLNASAAVIRLDVPLVKPDQDAALLTLHPSYAAAAAHAPPGSLLPSVNLLDGKAKQFDDGLYAALDQAYYRGLKDRLLSHVQLIRRMYDKAGPHSAPAPYLAAGLELAGVSLEPADRAAKERYLQDFNRNEVQSKPIGFYTWNHTLKACFRFLRFFQDPFDERHLAVPAAISQVLNQDAALLADYRKALAFYARLTNPYSCLSAADLVGIAPLTPERFTALCQERKVRHQAVALFPPSTSRETVLFEALFPIALPPNVDLMKELVTRIRSGAVNLQPGPDSGWYDHQVYALEVLLLPEKGEGHDKLLLTRAYKKRMLEAFQALLTKRRETHVRQLESARSPGAAPLPPASVRPHLRVEPSPSYYLRTARAYAFLANLLEAAVGRESLQKLHGLKQGGERKDDLHTELLRMRDLFYGLYLICAEDIGLRPTLAADEKIDVPRCTHLAADWLPRAWQDPDLAADTRVAVPIFVDLGRGATRLWMTLGVRLARLEAAYAKPPSIKSANGAGDWKVVEAYRLGPANYLIAVDEFAEVELTGLRVLTRDELRAICDREQTKEKILAALRGSASPP